MPLLLQQLLLRDEQLPSSHDSGLLPHATTPAAPDTG
eukprot:CAMPEP_0202921394 /NCGR_PEP_ID=MMETSP1392-20130828/77373_1 /ASSEMBLY_ACC=CAM_ASM_000868 /TAXON_ID=225041 /ORGANISM="Chlamydomonas chlamydogama, Strain SAG 11-48b" /LENGTH=36 /DNA_ID= /DNA_START= /DNA_END= /DNA_ORIENTATION=